ncbi:MAG TPA: HEAT repeat domain-containing protein, partial [Polyangiales bacterium]
AQLLGQAPPPAKVQRAATHVGSAEALRAQLGARDFRTRLKAVQALAHHPGDENEAALIETLRDRSVEVAVDAVHSLQSLAGPRARATLRAVLDNADGYFHPLVRAAAVHALGQLPGAPETPRVEQALYDQDAEVSIAAIAALSASAPELAREALLRVLDQGQFFLPITRLAAARSLSRLRGVPPARVAAFAEREGDVDVREVLSELAAAQA